MNADKVCPICYEDYVTPVWMLCCSKIHCKSCLDEWLVSNRSCPMCRAELSEKTYPSPACFEKTQNMYPISMHRIDEGYISRSDEESGDEESGDDTYSPVYAADDPLPIGSIMEYTDSNERSDPGYNSADFNVNRFASFDLFRPPMSISGDYIPSNCWNLVSSKISSIKVAESEYDGTYSACFLFQVHSRPGYTYRISADTGTSAMGRWHQYYDWFRIKFARRNPEGKVTRMSPSFLNADRSFDIGETSMSIDPVTCEILPLFPGRDYNEEDSECEHCSCGTFFKCGDISLSDLRILHEKYFDENFDTDYDEVPRTLRDRGPLKYFPTDMPYAKTLECLDELQHLNNKRDFTFNGNKPVSDLSEKLHQLPDEEAVAMVLTWTKKKVSSR